MKNTIKTLLVTITVLIATSSAVRAQLNQDLMFGITSASGGNNTDLVMDLGDPANLYYGESWALGTLLASSGNTNRANVQWGLVGATYDGINTLNVYTTSTSQPRDIQNINDIVYYYLDLIYLGYGFGNNGTSLAVGNYFEGSSYTGDGTSWYQQTTAAGQLGGNCIINDYTDPNLSGFGNVAFYDTVNDMNNPSSASQVGIFSLDNAGNLVYSVPEPSTLALAAMGGASLLLFRCRKQALMKNSPN